MIAVLLYFSYFAGLGRCFGFDLVGFFVCLGFLFPAKISQTWEKIVFSL